MRIVLTGSSGRIGRAIYKALATHHQVVGIDRSPFATTQIVADFADAELLTKTMEEANAVIHTVALHAPHVGLLPEIEFHRINVEGTRLVIKAAQRAGIPRLVFTSTTALFGQTISNGSAAWVTEETLPNPRTIYHSTKLEAEALLQAVASESFAVRVLRLSRCFPEKADTMALHRVSRGVDVRDVASAHVAALVNGGPSYQRYIISGKTPFLPDDCPLLTTNLPGAIQQRIPALQIAFQQRGWRLPTSLDRVYLSTQAELGLGWIPSYGFEEVLAQLDRSSLDVLPVDRPGNQLEK